MFDNAQPAHADVGQIGDVTQMGNADAIFDGSIEDTGPLGCMNDGPVYVNVDIL